MTTVPEDELPLLLPETDEIKPSGTGECKYRCVRKRYR